MICPRYCVATFFCTLLLMVSLFAANQSPAAGQNPQAIANEIPAEAPAMVPATGEGADASLSATPIVPVATSDFVVGGPLAGVRLAAQPDKADWGEFILYPNAVEHYRSYMLKYLPVRSFFDRQSLLKNWTVPALPGAENKPLETFSAPLYRLMRDCTGEPLNRTREPVKVIRCKVRDPIFKLDLGELEPGMYCVRMIGAVETSKLRAIREPLFITLRVNDGPGGQFNTYRQRTGYVDDFYDIGEVYFHATEKRHFQAEYFFDTGSTVDVLVHNITLDDALAGTERRAIKQTSALATPEVIEQAKATLNVPGSFAAIVRKIPARNSEARLARDRAIWNWIPPINTQGTTNRFGPLNNTVISTVVGTSTLTAKQIEEQYGKWEDEIPPSDISWNISDDPAKFDAFLINKKLNLRYTMSDLAARKPLPDPYPFKDDGAGLYFPDPQNPTKGSYWTPIADGVTRRYEHSYCFTCGALYNIVDYYLATGNPELGRDIALATIRYAYQYPSLESGVTCLQNVIAQPGQYGREGRCRQRPETQQWTAHYANYMMAIRNYDKIFSFIKGNEDLAKSVHRFVPWVNTSEDVIKLCDVYLVQHGAKRLLRYHDHTDPDAIFDFISIMGDKQITKPWVEWAFSRLFVYPLQPEGVQNLLITGNDRSGTQILGSGYYCRGEGASASAAGLDRFLAAGGDSQFNLGDSSRFPKSLAHAFWHINNIIAGQDFLRVGDVTGPDKRPGSSMIGMDVFARRGWRWSKDPRFAWVLSNFGKPVDETPAQWSEIQQAAKSVSRAPWLDLPSRSISNWASVLESGLQHDDFRFRRAAYVRVGRGIGHQHSDTFDLQIFAHGLPMTMDGGQRSGYSKPNDRFTYVHNTVDVVPRFDDYGIRNHSFVQSLADVPGDRFTQAIAFVTGFSTFQRQVSLVDVDEGKGSAALTIAQQLPDAALPKNVTTGNSYVFDVFRVAGGLQHAYCFHAMVNDDFQWNVTDAKTVPAPGENDNFKVGQVVNELRYLGEFMFNPAGKFAGTAPAELTATWRYVRTDKVGSEQFMAGVNYDSSSPAKFTRLHLFNTDHARALRADAARINEATAVYSYTNLMVRRVKQSNDAPLESAFAAIIEPYAGEPFIASIQPIAVTGNSNDAQRAVALLVKTKSGRTDVNFADGNATPLRHFTGPDGEIQAAGQHGFYSYDNQGLVTASLVGGTKLITPRVRIMPAAASRTATIAAVDFANKSVKLDTRWPSFATGVVQVGEPGKSPVSDYTIVKANEREIIFNSSADAFRSAVSSVNTQENVVITKLSPVIGDVDGSKVNIYATTDDTSNGWRADMVRGNQFHLTGRPVSADEFTSDPVLRLWEYGPGDVIRQITNAAIRRTDANTYQITANTALSIALPGSAVAISSDGKTWTPQNAPAANGWTTLACTEEMLNKPLFIRVTP